MALSKFDSRVLELMYELVKRKRFMNSVEISANCTVNGKVINDRSVRRWINFLKEHDFWYFPYLRVESFGLIPVFVLLSGLKDKKLLEIIPYQTYRMSGNDITNLRDCTLMTYLIPPEHFEQFKKFWEFALKRKLIEHYDVFKTRTSVTLYSPFHKMVDNAGCMRFQDDVGVDTYFTELLNKTIKAPVKPEIHQSIIENPLIVPIALEYFREHPSSKNTWLKMREHMGKDVWKFIKKTRKVSKLTDGVGIRFVQDTLKHLQKNFDDFFLQTKIEYIPFNSESNAVVFLFINLKKTRDLLELTDSLLKHSLYVTVCPPSDINDKVAIFYIVTSSEKMNEICSIMQKHMDKSGTNKIMWRDFKRSYNDWLDFESNGNYMKKNYTKLFDASNATWRYNSSEYFDKLKEMVNDGAEKKI